VAHNHHRVLASKDEWEVARLYSLPDFKAALAREFEGDYRLHFHVGGGPFGKVDKATGQPIKTEVGPWMLAALGWMARLRGLRGSVLDPFRRSAERQLDRQLLEHYEADVEQVLRTLSAATHPLALKWLSLPEQVRGYGHVKREQAAAADKLREQLRSQHAAAQLPQSRAA
jgi:indolepyruvate ferredoxin oxidoreductase